MSDILSRPADEFANDPLIEQLWAQKAVEHMQVHFNLISSLPPNILPTLKLTKNDDLIYTSFRQLFPDLSIDILTEDELKSESSKSCWRGWCESMKEMIEEFNYATMLRLDSSQDYCETNCIVVPRAQFVAIEVARNREGFNAGLKEKYGGQK